jgi:hypothetical protein
MIFMLIKIITTMVNVLLFIVKHFIKILFIKIFNYYFYINLFICFIIINFIDFMDYYFYLFLLFLFIKDNLNIYLYLILIFINIVYFITFINIY